MPDLRTFVWESLIFFFAWFVSGLVYSKVGAEVTRLRRLVEEAACLQAVNREREKLGFPIVYSRLIDREHPDSEGSQKGLDAGGSEA